jgi:F-type H+-transporting ATPase subunit epsilon
MADRLTLRLITAEADLLTAECDEVRAPGALGFFGVRPGRAPFLTVLDAGPLTYIDGKTERHYAVVDGFVKVEDDQVVVLAGEAVAVEDIDLEAEERALAEARARLDGKHPGEDGYETEAAIIRRAAARATTARH